MKGSSGNKEWGYWEGICQPHDPTETIVRVMCGQALRSPGCGRLIYNILEKGLVKTPDAKSTCLFAAFLDMNLVFRFSHWRETPLKYAFCVSELSPSLYCEERAACEIPPPPRSVYLKIQV